MLKNGANPNRIDVIGNTPLHLAACSSKVEIVNLLLQNGADCDISDYTGFTPWRLASSKLNMIMSSIRQNPDTDKYESLVKKCRDIVHMLDMCLCEKNLISLELQELKSKIKQKVEKTSSSTTDLENDVSDLLTSISALSIDSKPQQPQRLL